jgi:hypothetical protein
MSFLKGSTLNEKKKMKVKNGKASFLKENTIISQNSEKKKKIKR